MKARHGTLTRLLGLAALAGSVTWTNATLANPVFARQYDLSCSTCHAAFPRLNAFGQAFQANNIRLPDWKERVGVPTGDDMLVLPRVTPVAFRAQAYAQAREAEVVSSSGATTREADYDFQTPYLLKIFSAAPLTDHMSYYFYAILAEKGTNGEVLVEDAWISHDDLFGTGVGMTLGQFQLSDLMFPRETRLTFQDFIPYRMAGITYDRGVLFTREIGPIALGIGAVNGNGIRSQQTVNSGGYNRPDHAFDDNNSKTIYGRIGSQVGPVRAGLFVADGQHDRQDVAGTNYIDSRVYGIDLSGDINQKMFWFAQWLQIDWDDILVAGDTASWYSAFAGIDYVYSDRWTYSLLYNYGDANDFKGSGLVYEGIDLDSVTLAASYYFMRNVKGVFEVNVDLLSTDARDGVGHDTKEGYVLVGFDTAF